jgi:hypothetical protein
MFERPRKPELTEAQKTLAKKHEELAGCWSGGRRCASGLARELRNDVVILEQEITGWNRPEGVELTLFANCGAQTIAKLVVVN